MYNVNGGRAIPYNISGKNIPITYDVYGGEISGKILLSENFNTINTNIWKFKTGPYRDWQYLPADYSQNAFADNGKLTIRNLKDNPVEDYAWSGAFMDTDGKFSFQKGSIFARMKFSEQDYYHATFWLLGQNSRGEIDIAECDSGHVSAAVHYYDANNNLHSKLIGYYPVDATEFNIYQLDWTNEKLTFRYNGNILGSFKVTDATIDDYNSLDQPYYIVLNTNPYSTASDTYCTGDDVSHTVDYIKVYGFE